MLGDYNTTVLGFFSWYLNSCTMTSEYSKILKNIMVLTWYMLKNGIWTIWPLLSAPEVSPCILKEETRHYEDAGIFINSPYFSVLRKERHIDLIISLDFSDDDPFEVLCRSKWILCFNYICMLLIHKCNIKVLYWNNVQCTYASVFFVTNKHFY